MFVIRGKLVYDTNNEDLLTVLKLKLQQWRLLAILCCSNAISSKYSFLIYAFAYSH